MGFSALVAALAAALVFLIWFPSPFAMLAGGTRLFVLITSVDVVIGPLITLVVFNRAKGWPELRRDLAIVVLLQLAALGYGLHTMYVARPVVMALEGNRFRVVTVVDVLTDELPAAPIGLRELPLTGPVLVRTADVRPEDKMAALQLALKGYDVGARPSYWREWDETALQETRTAAKPVATLVARYPSRSAELNEALADTGRPREHLGFLPIISLHADAVALIDTRSGDIVGYAAFDGF